MEGTSPEELKREWRRAVAARRDALAAQQREKLSARLCEAVIRDVLEPLAARDGRPLAVCVYGAFRSEADPAGVARWCRTHGHRVLAPRVREDGGGMELRELPASSGQPSEAPSAAPGQPPAAAIEAPIAASNQLSAIAAPGGASDPAPDGWRSGRWGVPEPDPARTRLCPPDEPLDVVLVPGLAFDAEGGRLGYGGGYYDRLFAQRRAASAGGTLWLGFAYGLQKSAEPLPKEPHDLPLAGLATEEGILWFNEGKGDERQ